MDVNAAELPRNGLDDLEMADHPTDQDSDDDAEDRQTEAGSNSTPPNRITNRDLSMPPIDHNGHIDTVLVQLYVAPPQR